MDSFKSHCDDLSDPEPSLLNLHSDNLRVSNSSVLCVQGNLSPLFTLPKPSTVSPYNVSAWAHLLKNCLSSDKLWFLHGLAYGFDIECNPKLLSSAKRNCPSAYEHADVIDNYIKEEISFGSIAGPFKEAPFKNIHINRFGVIPKSTPGKWRLITDLSCPPGASVNDGIPSDVTHIYCKGIQTAIDKVMRYGKGALMAKFDFKRAYRAFPIRECDRYLLGMFWKDLYYVDLALPFGLSKAPNIFNRGADLLEWAIAESDAVLEDDIQHFYDDFFEVGPPDSDQCENSLDASLAICDFLGVPVEHSKTIRPTTCMKYLGFILDSELLELRLPIDKQDRVSKALSELSGKRATTKRVLLSLIGLLHHCCQAIPLGRPFLRRLIDRAHSVRELHHFVRLSSWEIDDIKWWHHLILHWNGKSLFLFPKWESGPDCAVTSDAATKFGFGAYIGKEWFADEWPQGTENISVPVKELIPIVIAAELWGHCWARKRIRFRSDNLAVVSTLQSGLCKDRHLAFCHRELATRAVLNNFTFSAKHVPGWQNSASDALSRFRFQDFRSLVPDANLNSTPVPQPLLAKLLFPPWTQSGED